MSSPAQAAVEQDPVGGYDTATGYPEPLPQPPPHRPLTANGQSRQPQPLPQQRQPARQPDPRQSVRGNNGLFAAEPVAPAAPAPRRSLFGIVTGAMRGAPAEPPAPAQPEPASYDTRGEPVRANVRQAAGEDMHIDIPAFLRRQSS
jgi:cell division protein FtsZ